MDPEKQPPASDGGDNGDAELSPQPAGEQQRIQFAPQVRPSQRQTTTAGAASDGIPITRRSQSVASIPQVMSEKEKDRRRREEEHAKKQVDVDEHLMPHADVAARYKTRINMAKPADSLGLTADQAAALLAEHGPNVLTPPKKRHPFLKFLDCLTSLFNLLLILAGVLEYILLGIDFKDNFQNVSASSSPSQPALPPLTPLAQTYLGAILILVAHINAFIEFYQQQKSQALLESFLNMIPARCMCVRDGKLAQIEAATLVPGDVVLARMGDKTPADILVFAASDCKVDNSSLTGESEPQERTKDNDMPNPLEATNVMFNSTLVVSGEAYGIVIRTGDATVLGQIAHLTAGEEKTQSPLSHEIDNFVKIIATIAIITALVFFGISFPVNNNNTSLALNFAIGIFVAWVPEGLPATVTMLLTIAAKRMASQNVLVKDLQGVETLGAITLLATDKTGTLTRNRMTVANLWTCAQLYEASGRVGNDWNVAAPDRPGVDDMLYISALCSRAKFDRTDVPVEQREILGDATESGLVRYAAEQLSGFDGLAEQYPKVFELPFNSDTKWHMSIHQKPPRQRAPDAVHQGRARACVAPLQPCPRRRRRRIVGRANRCPQGCLRRDVRAHGEPWPPRPGVRQAAAARRRLPGGLCLRQEGQELPARRLRLRRPRVAAGPAQARRPRGHRPLPRRRRQGHHGDGRSPADGRGHRPQDQPHDQRDAHHGGAAHRPAARGGARGRVQGRGGARRPDRLAV